MYSVNENTFTSYFKAIAEGTKTNSDVLEIATGIVRWQPARKVSNKEIRDYNDGMSAYEAQEMQKKRLRDEIEARRTAWK